MRILVLLSRFPYPLEKGDKLRAFHQLKDLGEKHLITLLCNAEQKPSQDDLAIVKKFCHRLEVFNLNKTQIYQNLLKNAFTGLPFQVAYFIHPKLKARVTEIVKGGEVDLIYCQLIRMAACIPEDRETPVYLDYMDAFSLNMDRRAQLSSKLQEWFFRREAKLVRQYELASMDRFQAFSVISKADQAQLAGKKSIKLIPNGIDPSFLNYQSKELPKKYDLIFTGNMGYYPNVQAALFLVNSILPLLPRELKVCIAGIDPSSEVRALANDRVVVTGFVEDLKIYLKQARLFVAPLFAGAGLQNKLLEAMALGVPCLSTTLANDALEAPTSAMIIADDATVFADHIKRLLSNKSERKTLGEAGRKYVIDTFSWEKSNQLLEQDMLKLIL